MSLLSRWYNLSSGNKKSILRPTVKPDCDNIAKNINDALNRIVYNDDKQIVSLTVNKFYSNDEYVKVNISETGG